MSLSGPLDPHLSGLSRNPTTFLPLWIRTTTQVDWGNGAGHLDSGARRLGITSIWRNWGVDACGRD